jgi:hypothetical protein
VAPLSQVGNSAEDVEAWRAERRKRFPTTANVAAKLGLKRPRTEAPAAPPPKKEKPGEGRGLRPELRILELGVPLALAFLAKDGGTELGAAGRGGLTVIVFRRSEEAERLFLWFAGFDRDWVTLLEGEGYGDDVMLTSRVLVCLLPVRVKALLSCYASDGEAEEEEEEDEEEDNGTVEPTTRRVTPSRYRLL